MRAADYGAGGTDSKAVQYGESCAEFEVDLFDAGDIMTVAKALEAANWDGIAFTEHPAPSYRWLTEGGGHQTLDPFGSATLAGGVFVG